MPVLSSHDAKKVRFIINAAFYALIAVIAYLVLKYTFFWAMPFIIGTFVAVILQPLIRFFKKRMGIPEGVSGVIFVIGFYVLVSFLLIRLGTAVYNEIAELIKDIPGIADTISASLASFFGAIRSAIKELPEFVSSPVETALVSLSDSLSELASQLSVWTLNKLKGFAFSLPGGFLFFVAMLLSSILIGKDYSKIKAFIYMQLPEKARMVIFESREFLVVTLFRLLRAYSILLSLTFIELSIGFLIIGINYPFIVAFLIAIIDVLPVFGCGTVLLPWALVSFVNQNFYLGFSILLLYAIITAIRQFVEPKVVGSQIGLNPLITLMCIYVGYKVMGVGGMIIFPIIFITVRKMQESGYFKLWTPVRSRKTQPPTRKDT